MLDEKIRVIKIFAMLCGITGILIVIQPWAGQYTSQSDVSVHSNVTQLNQSDLMSHIHVSSYPQNISIADLQPIGGNVKETSVNNAMNATAVNHSSGSANQEITKPTGLKYQLYLGLILISIYACLAACNIVHVKSRLTQCRHLVLCFWTGLCGIILSLIIMLIVEIKLLPQTLNWTVRDCILVLIHAVSAAMLTILTNQALKFTTPSIVQLAQALQVIFMLVFQYTLVNSLFPSHNVLMEVFGAILVVISSSILPIDQIKNQSQSKSDPYTIIPSEENKSEQALAKKELKNEQ